LLESKEQERVIIRAFNYPPLRERRQTLIRRLLSRDEKAVDRNKRTSSSTDVLTTKSGTPV